MTTILTIDIGGTKTEAALWQSSCTQPRLLQKCRFATDFADETGLLARLTPLNIDDELAAVTLAAAGRPNNADGYLTLTNNPCKLDAVSLQMALPPNARLTVLNDLEALAYALPYLPGSSLLSLNPQADNSLLNALYPRLAAACGTGFGAAALLPGLRALPTEAGHCRFAPANAEQAALCQKLAAAGALTNEALLSGQGLANIYQAISAQQPNRTPAAIAAAARSGEPAAQKAVREFSLILGAALGNLALSYLCGGVYLAGGVCQGLGKLLDGAALMAGLVIPGPFAAYLQKLPVMLITDESATNFGAAMYAERFLLG